MGCMGAVWGQCFGAGIWESHFGAICVGQHFGAEGAWAELGYVGAPLWGPMEAFGDVPLIGPPQG